MAGKNRVGSLYMELVLDPSKYAKGASQAVKDHRRMQKELSKAHGGLDPKTRAKADLDLAKQAAMRQIKLKKMTFEEGKAIVKAATANYKAEIKKIDNASFASDEKQLMSLKEKNDKEIADIKKAVKEEQKIKAAALAAEEARLKERQGHARKRRARRLADEKAEAAKKKQLAREVDAEQERLDKKYKAYLAHRHAVQRKWNKRHTRMVAEEARKQAALRRSAFAGGTFGSGGVMQGLGAITGGIGKLTQALFPLAIAGYAAIAMFRKMSQAAMAWVKAADEKTRNLLVLTTLLHGNKEAADELRNSLVKYAKATAFSVEQTMELAVQMKALGFTAKEIPSTLAKLGRLSFGDGGKLRLIAKAYSDVRAQGKLLMTEVRQFANQGVPLLAQLQMDLGKSALQVRDDMKAGLITFEQVETAINNIASAYGNVDEAGLATVSGQLEAAAEAWNEILAKTGKSETLLMLAKGLNTMLNGLDRLIGDFKLLDKITLAIYYTLRSSVAILTFGASEVALLGHKFLKWITGVAEQEERQKHATEEHAVAMEIMAKYKREQLDLLNRENAALAVREKAEQTQLDFYKRKAKLLTEMDAHSADPATKAKAEKDLARMEREADLQREIEESQKRIDQESDDTIAAAGQYNLSARGKEIVRANAEARKETEQRLIEEKHAAKWAEEKRDKVKKDAEELAKAEKKRWEEEQKEQKEWHDRRVKDAKELIKIAKEAQADFEKEQDEANKFKDKAPKTSPSFQANSIAEFTFRKEKELQRDKQREENRREAARKEHAERLNTELIEAIRGEGLNENGPDLGFEAIE